MIFVLCRILKVKLDPKPDPGGNFLRLSEKKKELR